MWREDLILQGLYMGVGLQGHMASICLTSYAFGKLLPRVTFCSICKPANTTLYTNPNDVKIHQSLAWYQH